MNEQHEVSFEEFDLRVTLNDEGDVGITFLIGDEVLLVMQWDDLREVIGFVGKHGLDMSEPIFLDKADPDAAKELVA